MLVRLFCHVCTLASYGVTWFNCLACLLACFVTRKIFWSRDEQCTVPAKVPSLRLSPPIHLNGTCCSVEHRTVLESPPTLPTEPRDVSAETGGSLFIGGLLFIGFVFHELTPVLTQVISRIATERYAFHRQQQWKQQATRLSHTPPGQRGHPSSAMCLVTLPLRTPLSTTNLTQTTTTWQKQGQQ